MDTLLRCGSLRVSLCTLFLFASCYPMGRMPAHMQGGGYGYGQVPSNTYAYPQPGAQPGAAKRMPAPQAEQHKPWNVVPEETMDVGDGSKVTCNWKERIAQPYVFLKHKGDYRNTGDVIRRLLVHGRSLKVSGPPFALFFDDPATVPVSELTAWVCLPVLSEPETMPEGMGYQVLPRAMVVYAEVPGSYQETGRSYGALFKYMKNLNWERSGPLREIYLVNPRGVMDPNDLLAEIQLPCLAR